MSRGPVADVVAISGLAAIVTLVIAGPVFLAPSDRMFGMEIVGRHHDPFTVMAQFERPFALGVYSQPVTDISGALLARLSGGVAAYNWLVLLSFPLSAAAAYLLARHLALSAAGATLAALAFAFSPFHLAQAAYHPHIAQTQWVPLYLLALWRCLDSARPLAIGLLGAATVGVTLSNFYGGLIAAVLTPVAVGAYWLTCVRTSKGAAPRLAVTVGALGLFALAGVAYVWWAAPSVVADARAFANPPGDAFRYSAHWWAYFVPPVAHPLAGDLARRVWLAAGVRDGLLEQQVGLGWGVVTLGLVAAYSWLAGERRAAGLAAVPVLAAVAVAALVCSLSPERTIGGIRFVGPSALLHDVLPMFRAYARFGMVVQLMAVLMAGIGVDCLRRRATRRARIVCAALVALAVVEYAVSPSAAWHDALPTTAHRWVVRQPEQGVLALDCTPLTQESASVGWLTKGRVRLLGAPVDDCGEPNLSQKMAALAYTHLLVRRDEAGGLLPANRPAPEGFRVAARFDDGQVLAVTAAAPTVYTGTMTGFFPRERDASWTWRWMGNDASWTILNTGAQPTVASLGIELSAFHRARRLEVRFDGRDVQALLVEPERRVYQIGPITVKHGSHELRFHAAEAAPEAGDVIHSRDRRPLSFAIGEWHWTERSSQP